MASPASNAPRTADTWGAVAGSPETSSRAPDSRPAIDVTAITTRDDFLLELGEALGGQASVRPVESMELALQGLSSTKRAQILVIDTRGAGNLRADVELSHAQAPNAIVLVFAEAGAEQPVGTAVKGSNVFAVLPIPIDPRKTQAVLEGAMADALARRTAKAADPAAAPTSPATQAEPRVESRAGSRAESRPESRVEPGAAACGPTDTDSEPKNKAVVWAGVAVGVVALAAGGYWFWSQGQKTASPSPTIAVTHPAQPGRTDQTSTADDASLAAQPVAETSLVQGKVDELLEKARQAMRERRYSEPAGDNALLYYRSAAAADATNGEAIDGLQRVATVLASRFEEAMTGARYEEAALALASLKVAQPKDSRIPGLETRLTTAQVSKALADGNVDRAAALIRLSQQSSPGAIAPDQIAKWRAEIARHQEDSKVQHLASLASDRIRDGRLLDPAEDSAKGYWQQLRDLAPTSAATQRLSRDLNAAYLRKAREASLANHSAEADRWLSEAKAAGVSAADIASFQHDLTAAHQKAVTAESDRLAQLARDRIKDGRLTEPAQDSATFFAAQLQTSDPSSATLASLSRDLAAKLLERARASAQAGKSALVDSDLAQAKRWGADPKDLLAIQQIQSAPKTPAAGANAAVDLAALASKLKRVRYVDPDYPSSALAKQINGMVTVEYTVDAKGNTRDVRVIEATPPGIFDRAAINAIKRWRFEPVAVNGVPVEIPVRTAIRFELPK